MDSDEREIRQLISTWMEATKAGDVDAVLGLMAEDVVFLVPGQPPMIGKAAYAAAARAQAEQGLEFDGRSEIQEVQGHTLSILRKQGGRWVLARDANLLAPEPADR